MSGFTTAKINSLPDQASGIKHLFLRKLHFTLNTSDLSEVTILALLVFLSRYALTVYYKVEMCTKMRAMDTVCLNSFF